MSNTALSTLRTAYLKERQDNLDKYGGLYVKDLEAIEDPLTFFKYMYQYEDLPVHYFPTEVTDEFL